MNETGRKIRIVRIIWNFKKLEDVYFGRVKTFEEKWEIPKVCGCVFVR